MSRASNAAQQGREPAPPRHRPAWRNRWWRRARSLTAETAFHGLAGLASLHPPARPARHGVAVERDASYGPDPRWHRLDLYRPVHRPGPWPVVFYVHGGGFQMLSKDTHWLMGLVFARHGYLVVNISYRLAPEHPYPAALEDTCAAYRWLAARIGALGGDPARVAVAGESAGGNLITALALTACQRRDEPWARAVFDTGLVPRAVLPFCAMLEVSRPERFSQRRRLPRWIDGMIRDASASYLHGHPPGPGPATALADPLRVLEESRDATRGGVNGPALPGHPPEGGHRERPLSIDGAVAGLPARGWDRPLPPFFAPVGTRDPLLDDTRRLARALDGLGVPCEARYYLGGIHAFHALVWDPAARACWRDALAFLDRHMRKP